MMYHVDGGSGVQIGAPPPDAAGGSRGTRQRGDESALHRRGVRKGLRATSGFAKRNTNSQWEYNNPFSVAMSISVYDRETGRSV